jgi:hypothetical protein
MQQMNRRHYPVFRHPEMTKPPEKSGLDVIFFKVTFRNDTETVPKNDTQNQGKITHTQKYCA